MGVAAEVLEVGVAEVEAVKVEAVEVLLYITE
jgi:hypothetical protein